MEVVIHAGESHVAQQAVDVLAQVVRRRPGACIGVATGASVSGVYQLLAARVQAGDISMRGVRVFLLDEYVGLSADHPNSYRRFIRENLVDVTDIDPDRVDGPRGDAVDLDAECLRYEQALQGSGGIAIQLLGIGRDGHIAFNEPGSSLGSLTRVKTLGEQTRRDNARFFDEATEVPFHVITQGVATILRAEHILLLATGLDKAEAVARAVEGPISSSLPASALQLHPSVTALLDEDAARCLKNVDYYRSVWEHKYLAGAS